MGYQCVAPQQYMLFTRHSTSSAPTATALQRSTLYTLLHPPSLPQLAVTHRSEDSLRKSFFSSHFSRQVFPVFRHAHPRQPRRLWRRWRPLRRAAALLREETTRRGPPPLRGVRGVRARTSASGDAVKAGPADSSSRFSADAADGARRVHATLPAGREAATSYQRHAYRRPLA